MLWLELARCDSRARRVWGRGESSECCCWSWRCATAERGGCGAWGRALSAVAGVVERRQQSERRVRHRIVAQAALGSSRLLASQGLERAYRVEGGWLKNSWRMRTCPQPADYLAVFQSGWGSGGRESRLVANRVHNGWGVHEGCQAMLRCWLSCPSGRSGVP